MEKRARTQNLNFVYGLKGILRRRSGGMVAPVVAHTVTYLAVVWIVPARVGASPTGGRPAPADRPFRCPRSPAAP